MDILISIYPAPLFFIAWVFMYPQLLKESLSFQLRDTLPVKMFIFATTWLFLLLTILFFALALWEIAQ